MSHFKFQTYGLCLSLIIVGQAQSQDIRTRTQPAPSHNENQEVVYDSWTLYGALRDDKEASVLGSTCKTKDEAMAKAKKWLAENHAVNKPTDFTYLKFVEVVGEATLKEKSTKAKTEERDEEARKLLERVKFAKDDYEKAKKAAIKELEEAADRKLGDTIKEYGKMVDATYGRVKDAKKLITGDVRKLNDKTFRDVNTLIDQFNREVTSYRNLMGSSRPLGFNTIDRVEKPKEMDGLDSLANKERKEDKPWVVGVWENRTTGTDGISWTDTLTVLHDGTATKKNVWSGPNSKDVVSIDKYRWKETGNGFLFEHVGEVHPNGNEVSGDTKRNWSITRENFIQESSRNKFGELSSGWKRVR